MKSNMFLSVFLVIFLAFTANVEARTGQRPEGICTRDLNLWGHASHCSCSDGQVYDERTGLCLRRAVPEKIVIRGVISSGMMAIGGETTGFQLTTSEGIVYELILKDSEQVKLLKQGETEFELEGELVTFEGVEIKERSIFVVDRMTLE